MSCGVEGQNYRKNQEVLPRGEAHYPRLHLTPIEEAAAFSPPEEVGRRSKIKPS